MAHDEACVGKYTLLFTSKYPSQCHHFELELELIQSHIAQKPMLRGEVGACVRVIHACGQRREGRYGRARWCKAPG